MEMDLLFRFRDLVASTLQAHRDIIRQHGRCWWGWWKRPGEDGREDAWRRLTDALLEHGEVPVGLFDSGRGLVHRAWVTGVVTPRVDPATGDLQPMPVTPREQVPPYYRDSPFSRAWLQISRIDPEPVEFFGKYSYAHAPPLLGLSHDEVEERLCGKIVADASELRSMDTTIWQVRTSRPGDALGRVLLAPRALTEPISTTPILLKHSAVLHLTDLHFALGKFRKQHRWRLESEPRDGGRTLSEAVNEALHVTRHGRIGLIIITGDLTFTGGPDEFAEAARSVERLLGMLDLGPDHLVIIPGNHDIGWAEDGHYSAELPVVRAPKEAKRNYMDFHQAIFRHKPNHNLSMGRRYVMPHGGLLEVCALNSSALKTGHNFLAGMGRIDEAAFEDVKNRMRWEEGSLALRLLAIHHHLTLTENLEHPSEYAKGFGIAIDAPRIQRLMARHGVQLAMHGHKHRAFIWRSRVYELPESNRDELTPGELSIVGGGSAGSTDVPGDTNWFNVVQPRSAGVDLHMYRSEGAGIFSRSARYFAPFSLEGNPVRLRLEEWRVTHLTGGSLCIPLHADLPPVRAFLLTGDEMAIRCVVLDFDGTFTDVEQEALPFEAVFQADIADLLGRDVSTAWAAKCRLVEDTPDQFGWEYGGRIVAPANADPYVRCTCVAQLLMTDAGILKNAETRSMVLQAIYQKAYKHTLTAFRPDAKDVLARVLAHGLPVYVVTNAHTAMVQKKLLELGVVEGPALKILGEARKFVIAPDSNQDARFTGLPEEQHLPGLSSRTVFLKRGKYFDALRTVWAETGVLPVETLVCGDIYELDLALPVALGMHVHLVARPGTPRYERQALAALGERGGVSDALSGLLARLDLPRP